MLRKLLDHQSVLYTTRRDMDGSNMILRRECLLCDLMHSILNRRFAAHTTSNYDRDNFKNIYKQLEEDAGRINQWINQYSPQGPRNHASDCDTTDALSWLSTKHMLDQNQILQAIILYHKANFFLYCPWIACITATIDCDGVLRC